MTQTLPFSMGPYTVQEVTGTGGMATVYRAYHERLDRTVAIKLMHKNFLADPTFRARFEREAKIVARLEHPHIVPVYDFSDYDGQPYIVLKFIDGQTLKDLLRAGPVSTPEVVRILDAVADALSHAHEQGVLHRDIKPSNVLLDADGRPYLTDFGLARLATAGESTMSADVMLGTPHYISPEQAKGQTDLDARTDIYSLGVVLYELVVGEVPFAGDTPYAIVHDHIYAALPDPRSKNPALSERVVRVLERALAKRPEDRFETPRALMDAFKEALAGSQVAPPQVQAAPPQPVAPRLPQTPRAPGRMGPPPFLGPGPRRHEPREDHEETDGPWGEVSRELRKARREAEREMREAVRENTPVNPDRMMWKPGAEWLQDVNGRYGFYTPSEIDAQINALPQEEALRLRAERKLKARGDMQTGIGAMVGVIIFLWVLHLFVIGGEHPWPIYPTFGIGIGIFAIWMDYRTKYGAGRDYRESVIEREMARERERMSGVSPRKAKNDEEAPGDPGDEAGRGVRLTADGEFTQSFIEELDDEAKRKRR